MAWRLPSYGGIVVEQCKRLVLYPASRRWWAAMVVSTTISLLTVIPLVFGRA